MKWTLLSLISASMLIISGCNNSGANSNNNQFTIAVSSADPQVARYVAESGDAAIHTYAVTITNNGPISLQPGTFSITTNALSGPFSVTQNNCQNVTRGETCNISVIYSPQSPADYFNSQTLTFTSNSGQTQSVSVTGVPPTVTAPLLKYAPNRTGLTISDGGSQPFTAMLDTGSTLLVIEQEDLGPNAQSTGQQVTVQYASGSVTGTLYLANVTLNNNSNITTGTPAPMVVVPQGSLAGFSATAIFGVKMDNQVSTKDFLLYPYNQMMIIDRPDQLLTLGAFNNATLNSFSSAQLTQTPCVNYDITNTTNTTCWYDRGVPVTYTITGDPDSPRVIGSIFDSGEPHTTYYVKTKPAWVTLNAQGYISNPMTASLNINGQNLSIPLTPDIALNVSPDNTERFNTGYSVFDNYKVLLNQANGVIGLKNVP